MYIEMIKLNFSDRKENIKQISHSVDFKLEKYTFEIKKVVLDKESQLLYLYGVNWLNNHKLKSEDEIIKIIEDNISTLIYNCLLES